MVNRFDITTADLKAHGGILNTATYYADKEYTDALATTPWSAPRSSPTSFVRFLDHQGFKIPWYIEKSANVNRLKSAAQSAQTECSDTLEPRCEGENGNVIMANSIASALLMGKYNGWNVRGQFALNSERSPDAVLDELEARCSEWLTSLKGASLFVGGDVKAQIVPGKQYHIEAYWVVNPQVEKLWNLKLFEGENAASQAAVIFSSNTNNQTLITPADTVVAISINRILSSNADPRTKHLQLRKLQNWGGSHAIRAWLHSAIEVYANSGY